MKKQEILCLLTASLLLISSSLFSFGEELEGVEDQLENAREEQRAIEAQIEENEMEESEIIEKIEEIEMGIIEAESEIEGIESKITAVQEEIVITEEELSAANREINEKNELLSTRVSVMYRKGSISYIEILLGSRDFSELLSNVDMIRKIADHDVQLIEELERQVALVKDKQETLKVQKNELSTYQQEVESKIETLQVSRGTQKRLRQEIQSTISGMEEDLAEREEESKFLEGEIQRIEREIQERMEAERRAAEERARKEAEEQARLEAERKAKEAAEQAAKDEADKEAEEPPEPEEEQNGSEEDVQVPVMGEKSWPVPGFHRISSAYGYRTHPIFGDWRPHWGIDVPAPMGTPIVAALPGEVMLSAYGGSYGNYVVIYHGEGLSTLYAHNTSNHVTVGDQVEQGQVIASIGSTGNSTGPHIHFEVRLNGDPKLINPYQWLNQ